MGGMSADCRSCGDGFDTTALDATGFHNDKSTIQ
jgi:hypothetical protein